MKRFKLLISSLALILVPALVITASPLSVFGDCNAEGGITGALDPNCSQPKDTPNGLFDGDNVIGTIINVLLFIVGIISVIMLIYGGIKYSTSAGDTAKVTSAKNTIMYAIVGLVVSILAYAIVNFVVGNLN